MPYLARLLSRVKYPKVKKRIQAALNEAAAKAGITRAELDELSVPTHDLEGSGAAEIAVGQGAALLAISGTASVDVCVARGEREGVQICPGRPQGAQGRDQVGQGARQGDRGRSIRPAATPATRVAR